MPPLTDIGLPRPYEPMDFAAWMEVYLAGRWHAFDSRNNTPRIGRILIAHGRDAADVPLTHTFGPGTLSGFRVWADEAPAEWVHASLRVYFSSAIGAARAAANVIAIAGRQGFCARAIW
jgi:transglutaminase-like putative cysteine protease